MKFRLFALTIVLALIIGMILPVAAQDAPTLVIWADDTRAEPVQALGDQFFEENGIAVEVVELEFNEIRDQFKTAGPAGEGPDIIIGAHDWLGELVINGLLLELDLGDNEDAFVPAAVNAFRYDGALYGVPYAMENVAFVRNTELVPEAPATWDEVRAISEQIQADGAADYGYIIQENDPYHFFGLQTAYGGYVFGYEDGVGYDAEDVGVDSEGSIEALSWLEQYTADGLMPAGLDYDTMHALFESGDAAMMITGPWAISRIEESGVPFEISAIPGEGQPFLGVQGFMVSAFSDNATLASLFLTDYIATEDAMQAIFDAGDRPSAFVAVRENTENAVLTAFGEAGENGLAMPAIPEMSAVWTAWGNAMQLVVQGQVDAETAFTDAGAQIRETIAGNS